MEKGSIDLIYGGEPEAAQDNVRTVPEDVSNLKQSLVEASYAAARETLGTKLQRQKEFYNRKVHGDPHKTGDLVMLFSPVVTRKFRYTKGGGSGCVTRASHKNPDS